MGEQFTVNSLSSLAAYSKYVSDQYAEHKYITFSPPRIGPDRSLDQNALSHCWYNYADKMLSELIGSSRNFCKLHFGIPILRAEDEEFRVIYDTSIKPLPYEQKLKVIGYFPVSSLMSRNQMTRYLSAIQMHYAENHSLVLESKGEFAKLQRKESGQ